MSRPVIGICATVERVGWGPWEVEVNLSQRTYSREVAAAGGQPVILPPSEEMSQAPEEVLGLLDALILAGGGDVDPAAYGAEAAESTQGVRPERDRFEFALCLAALELDLPLLGICRGMQLLNVALGGDLIEQMESASTHLDTPGVFSDHEVILEPGSLAARAAGAERISVSSHHHQGIGSLGRDLVVSGRAAEDEVIEAVELEDHSFVLGVLWHTEEERGSRVIGSLVAGVRTGTAAR